MRCARRAGAGRHAAGDGRSTVDPLHLPEPVATAADHQRLPELLRLVPVLAWLAVQRRVDAAGHQLEAGAADAVVAGDLPMPGRPVCTWSSCWRFAADHVRVPELQRLVPMLA